MSSVGDVQASINILRYYAGWCDKIHGNTIPVGLYSHFILTELKIIYQSIHAGWCIDEIFVQPVAITGGPKDPDPTKILMQWEFYINVLGPRKYHCIKNLNVE